MAWDDTKTDAVDVLHAADYNEIVSQVKSKIAAAGVTYENLNANGDVGTTSGTVCAGDDSRLSDSRTPTSHGNEAHSSTFLTEIAWGDITGTLSDQTDLGNVLDGKATLPATEGATGLDVLRLNADKSALEFATPYSLPTATATVLGGVKIGSGITITDGVISAEGGGGDVSGPSSTTENKVPQWDSTTKLLKDGLTIGTGASNLVQLTAESKLPAVDGSLLTNLPSGGGITWNEVTGTTQTAAADNGYIANNAGLVTVTLPATCAVGKVIHVAGKGSGGWTIAQNAEQTIVYGNVSSTTGTGGSVSSTHARDCIGLLCTVADTEFMVYSWVGTVEVV